MPRISLTVHTAVFLFWVFKVTHQRPFQELLIKCLESNQKIDLEYLEEQMRTQYDNSYLSGNPGIKTVWILNDKDEITLNKTTSIFHPFYGYCETIHESNIEGQS